MSQCVFDDRLEVISTGLLPAGITVADLKRSHASLPRNSLIAGVLYRCGLILSDREKWKVHDILAGLENPPGLRVVQLDLRLLREYGLVETSGRGGNARWWLEREHE
jgi:Putative ATP-dependent DNA helicase recG C-terminal